MARISAPESIFGIILFTVFTLCVAVGWLLVMLICAVCDIIEKIIKKVTSPFRRK